MQRICRFPKSLFYVKVIYTGKKDVHTKINNNRKLACAMREKFVYAGTSVYSKAMHAGCKKKKKETQIYPGAKQEAEESPRPYPRHYPSLQSSSTSLTTHTLRNIPVQGNWVTHMEEQIYPHKSRVVRQVPPGMGLPHIAPCAKHIGLDSSILELRLSSSPVSLLWRFSSSSPI